MFRWVVAPLLIATFAMPALAQEQPKEFKFLSPNDMAALVPSGKIAADIDKQGNHSVAYGSRTDHGNRAEIHARVSHYVVIVSGSGTLTYGGTVSNAQQTAPDQIRGDAIVGGNTVKIKTGDYMQIPAGMPHLLIASSGSQLGYLSMSIER